MASRIRTARDARTGDRPSVAAELDAIFAPLPRITRVADPAAPVGAVRQRRGSRLWFALLGAVAIAALIASLVFLMPIARQAPRRAAAKAPVTAAHKLPARTTVITAPQPAAPPPKAAETPPVATLSHSAAPKRASVRPTRHDRCPRFATTAWCLHGTIMAADDRLRAAYQAAVRAGVDRHTLIDVRSDWKRLRGRANRDPQALIRGYALLTQELRAEAGRARR